MRKTLKSLCFILSCSAVMHVSSQAAAQDVRTAALTPGNEVLREAPLPAVLAQDDLNRYRRIFALQQADRWADADREIAGLHDKLLVGAVLAQRYQDSGYHPSYAELVQWMQRYGDQPDAQTIFAAALKLRPDGAAQPPAPIGIATTAAKSDSDFEPRPTAGNFGGREMRVLVPAEERQANALRQQIRDLAGTDPRKAELLLAGKDAKALIDDQTRDQLRSTIAEGYLARGKAQEALTMSASTETAAYAPVANWNAGLAAWRLDRMDEARGHFQALARSPDQSPWVKAAAAFWAARVELRARRPENYSFWLRTAAENPRTFYGLLARRLLGVDQSVNADPDPVTQFDAQLLVGVDAGKRALALIAINQPNLAAEQIQQLALSSSPALLQSLSSLADKANLPDVSVQIAGLLGNGNGKSSQEASIYPVPRWEPRGGFTVDRALLYALMRQESGFAPNARNHSGAAGLMQLMPATARSMAARTGEPLAKGRKNTGNALSDPGYNLMLAQEYVRMLLQDGNIKNNLILFAAAYNRGPAGVAKWQNDRPEYAKDPLLFLESIPSQQSRVFVLRVMTNYWGYRQRLSQPTPDLDALAAGKWPTYTAFDGTAVAKAGAEKANRHAQN